MDQRAGPSPPKSAVQPAPSPGHARSRAETPRWPFLLLLMAMTAIGPVSFTALVPAIPAMATALATSSANGQLAISLFLFSLAAAQLFVGPLADRFGRRPVALIGLALHVVASLVAFFVTDFAVLIAARIVQAIGAAVGVVVSRAMLRDLFDRNRAAAMLGLVAMVMAIAPAFAPLIGGVLDTAFGWPSIFLFMALFGSVVLIWAVFKLPETQTAMAADEPRSGFISDLKALSASATFHGYVLAGGFGSATFFAFLGGGPHIIVTVMGYSSAEYGMWFMISSLGYVVGNFIASRYSVKYGIDKLIWWGIIAELVGVVLTLGLTTLLDRPGAMSLFLPQAIVAMGNGMLLPNAISGAVSVRPQVAGTAAGFTGFTQTAIGALATQFSGFVLAAATSAIPLAVIMTAIVILDVLVFGLLVSWRKPKRSEV